MPLFTKEGTTMLLSPELTGVAMASIAWVFMYLAATAFVSATKRTPGRLEKQMVSGIHHMPCLSFTSHNRGATHEASCAQDCPVRGSTGTIASMEICMSKLARSSSRSGRTP